MITPTGNGLNILIECEYKPIENWMSFISWYSIIKNLPDAEVFVVCKRGIGSNQFYMWPRRAKVKFFMYNEIHPFQNVFTIKPNIAALRTYDEQLIGPADVRSDVLATFVDYSKGCGKFVVAEWINRAVGPFQEAVKKFSTNEMSANEIKLLNLWQQSYGIYSVLEGG